MPSLVEIGTRGSGEDENVESLLTDGRTEGRQAIRIVHEFSAQVS